MNKFQIEKMRKNKKNKPALAPRSGENVQFEVFLFGCMSWTSSNFMCLEIENFLGEELLFKQSLKQFILKVVVS